jgi:hypothetical protein
MSVTTSPSSSSSIAWACRYCTFQNPANTNLCQACGSENPKNRGKTNGFLSKCKIIGTIYFTYIIF